MCVTWVMSLQPQDKELPASRDIGTGLYPGGRGRGLAGTPRFLPSCAVGLRAGSPPAVSSSTGLGASLWPGQRQAGEGEGSLVGWVLGNPAVPTLTFFLLFLRPRYLPLPTRPRHQMLWNRIFSLVYSTRCQRSRIRSHLSGLNCPYAIWTARG